FGVLSFLPARAAERAVKFDAFGFITLGLAIGALQAMLDRGEQLDWFGSLEIRIEAILAGVSFLYFLAHTATAGPKSFFRYQLLKDRNFATGACFIFVIGAVMYATRALLPPMLQNLMGYPVATTGLVTAPSGAGTMLSMLLAGRLLKRIDARVLLLSGFLISAFALWQMMQYTVVLSVSDIVWPGIIQGFGLGLVFVPLSALTFSTLAPELRAASIRRDSAACGVRGETRFISATGICEGKTASTLAARRPGVKRRVCGAQSRRRSPIRLGYFRAAAAFSVSISARIRAAPAVSARSSRTRTSELSVSTISACPVGNAARLICNALLNICSASA
ncbi:MAG: MFS transporter, partial [bacterium]